MDLVCKGNAQICRGRERSLSDHVKSGVTAHIDARWHAAFIEYTGAGRAVSKEMNGGPIRD